MLEGHEQAVTLSYPILSYLILSYQVLEGHEQAVWCVLLLPQADLLVSATLILSYLILSYLISPDLILSYPGERLCGSHSQALAVGGVH